MSDTELTMLQTTMDMIAENGLDGFSMKKVSVRMGCSDTLLYKYFGSRENMLLQCYLLVNRQIAELFTDVHAPSKWNPLGMIDFVHKQWERYFRFMVENGNRSLFYYAFRDSAYLQKVLMRNNPQIAETMEPFMNLTYAVTGDKLRSGMPVDYVWLFLLEGTGAFVKRAIRDRIPLDEIDVESIWKLISGGLKCLI